ncbi:hypothetical protein HanIR_Chr13g0669771 [Helianthus annuus]|nr:hypothetical protein HanIR_Chr13g0669771 [Helianthus annuus]
MSRRLFTRIADDLAGLDPVRTPVLQFLGSSIDAGIILLTEYIRLGLQLSRLFHIPRTKKGKNSPSVKKLQEKTSNVVLVFYKKKNGPQFNNRHVRSHRRGCAFVCMLAFCSIT